jgi:superfamily II DNA or RNA helicase
MTLSAYQQELVDQVVGATTPARFFLSSPPGGGKTAAIVATAAALQATREGFRCLTIVPTPLAEMWKEQMIKLAGLEAIVMTPQTYRRLQAETGRDVNVWSTVSCVAASIEFLKADERMEDVLAVNWDLVILDEAHRSTKSTQRGDVAEKIWRSSGVGIAIATTGLPNLPEWIEADSGTKKIHWKFSDFLKHVGAPQRRIHTINFTPSDSERQIATLVDDLVSKMPKDRASQFAASQLLRRLKSSMYALEQTLRRLQTVENFGDTDLNDWSADDIDENNVDTSVANSVRIDHSATEKILELLEGSPSDSKWECCFNLLNDHGIGKTTSGIVFTDYADTAEYLEYMAKSRDLKVFLLTGASTTDQRGNSLQQAKSIPSLLIATRAIEGANLAFTDQVIHYDLPWNPNMLLQRMGRVERVTSQFETINHYHIMEQCAAKDALTSIMDKLRSIEEKWK